VERGRLVQSNSSGFKVLGKSLTKPLDRLSKDGLIRYVVSLPLNSIPGVGTAFFLVFNGGLLHTCTKRVYSLSAQVSNPALDSTHVTSSSKTLIEQDERRSSRRGGVHILRTFFSPIPHPILNSRQIRSNSPSSQPRTRSRAVIQLDINHRGCSVGQQARKI